MRRVNVPPAQLLWLVAGFIVWSSAFVALYAVNAIGCAFGWAEWAQRVTLLGLLLLHAAILVWMLVHLRHKLSDVGTGQARLFFQMGLALTLVALVSTIAVFVPSAFATLCI